MKKSQGFVKEPTLDINRAVISTAKPRAAMACLFATAMIRQFPDCMNVVVSDQHLKASFPSIRQRVTWQIAAWAYDYARKWDRIKKKADRDKFREFKVRLFDPSYQPMRSSDNPGNTSPTSGQRTVRSHRSPRCSYTMQRTYGHRRYKVIREAE